VTLDDLPGEDDRVATGGATDTGAVARGAAGTDGADQPVLRGEALVIWDPARPGAKLDAIDTDQITPADDCVSESLETLDARWKAGAFRHLIPDFRARVHRGETFLVAGARFAIGSSREMSPAGLKAIAEEAGRELVIVAGEGMGDIFRRNALNLGLHVVECPEAVADAGDGDRFEFDPASRALTNLTRARRYTPRALTEREEEIRRAGGIVAVGRRLLRRSAATTPRIEWPEPEVARRLTSTQQILWAHRVEPDAGVEPGTTLRVHADLLPASDGTAPFAIHTFERITGGDTLAPRQAAIVADHFVFTGRQADARQTAISRDFAARHGIERPYLAEPGEGIFHFYLPEQGLVLPGQVIAGADSHSRAYGAYGAVGIGVGSTALGFGWATGQVFVTVPEQRRVVLHGHLQPWVSGKDVVLELLRRWGSAQAGRMSVELVDRDGSLPIAYRNTIANMMAEAEALNGLFAPDAVTRAWYAARGVTVFPYPPVAPGEEATYAADESLDLEEIVPMIARPFSPSRAVPAAELAAERLGFDKALIGSCTNGSYEDLLQAALVLRAARFQGAARAVRELVVFPGSLGVKQRIELPDPRLDGDSVAGVLRAAGAAIRDSWCGPCFGQGPDALRRGQRAITTFNRNWQNRMGVGGEGYLASPAVVAASAVLGYMAAPDALGIAWDAERFAV
jgi:3-isopropylmalate/(R)-2-methylmalate dehydratase large subunit